jgi:hypothetical protein
MKETFFKKIIVSILFSWVFVHTTNAQPDWKINAADYNLDGSIIANITINNQLSLDSEDKIAAFDNNGEIRGVANLTFDTITDTYIAYLTVLSTTIRDLLTFKVYDASENKIYLTNNIPVIFKSNLKLGTIFDPYTIISDGIDPLAVKESLLIQFSFAPNPIINFLSLEYPNTITVYKIILLDIHGSQLKQFISTQKKLNLEDLKQGIYILHIVSDKGEVTKKIIKQ